VIRKLVEWGQGQRWEFATLELDLDTGRVLPAADGSFSTLDDRGTLIENYGDRDLRRREYDSKCDLIVQGERRTIDFRRPDLGALQDVEVVPGTGCVLLLYANSAPILFEPQTGRETTLAWD
jgi:hypothetical protein